MHKSFKRYYYIRMCHLQHCRSFDSDVISVQFLWPYYEGYSWFILNSWRWVIYFANCHSLMVVQCVQIIGIAIRGEPFCFLSSLLVSLSFWFGSHDPLIFPMSVLAVFFSTWAFAYLRQTLDPSSSANASRAPSYANRTGEYPSHYNPPYNAGFGQPYYGQQSGYGYGYSSDTFVPPDEAKPGYTLPEGKLGYDEDTKDPFADQHRPSGSRV